MPVRQDQRQDVHRVVVQDGRHSERLARAQILEVHVRDHLPRQIAFPLDAEDLVLEIHQPAAIEA